MSSPIVLKVSVRADGTAQIDDLGKKLSKVAEKGSMLKHVFGGMLASMITYNIFAKFTETVHQSITEILKFNKTMLTTLSIFQSADKIVSDYIKNTEGKMVPNLGKKGAEGVKRQIEDMKDYVIELANSMEFSSSTISEAVLNLTKLGLPIEETKVIIKTVADLSTATGTDLTEALTGAIQISRSFGLELGQINKAAHTMATTVLSTEDTFTNYMEAMKMVAPIAYTVGLSLEETSLYIGALGNIGLRGTMGGTALKNMLLNMLKPADEVRKALRSTNLEGMTFYKVLMTIKEKGVSVLGFLDTFNLRAMPGALGIINQLPSKIEELFEKIKKSGMNVNEIAFSIRKSWSDQMAILKNNMINVGIEFSRVFESVTTGGAFQGVINFLQSGQKYIRIHHNEIKIMVQDIIDKAVKYAKTIISFSKEIWTAIKIVFAVSAVNLFVSGLYKIVGALNTIGQLFIALGTKQLVFNSLAVSASVLSGALTTLVVGLITIHYWTDKLNKEADLKMSIGGDISPEGMRKKYEAIKKVREDLEKFQNEFLYAQMLNYPTQDIGLFDFYSKQENIEKYKNNVNVLFSDIESYITKKQITLNKNLEDAQKEYEITGVWPQDINTTEITHELLKLESAMKRLITLRSSLGWVTNKDILKGYRDSFKEFFTMMQTDVLKFTELDPDKAMAIANKVNEVWSRLRELHKSKMIDLSIMKGINAEDLESGLLPTSFRPEIYLEVLKYLEDIYEKNANIADVKAKAIKETKDLMEELKRELTAINDMSELYNNAVASGDFVVKSLFILQKSGEALEGAIKNANQAMRSGFLNKNKDLLFTVPVDLKLDLKKVDISNDFLNVLSEDIKDEWKDALKKMQSDKMLSFTVFDDEYFKKFIEEPPDVNNVAAKLVRRNLNIYAEYFNQLKDKMPEVAEGIKIAMKDMFKLLLTVEADWTEGKAGNDKYVKKVLGILQDIVNAIIPKERTLFDEIKENFKNTWNKFKDDISRTTEENKFEPLGEYGTFQDKAKIVFENIWKSLKIAYETTKSGAINIYDLLFKDMFKPTSKGNKISQMVKSFIQSEEVQQVISATEQITQQVQNRMSAWNDLYSVRLQNIAKESSTEMDALDKYYEKKKQYAAGDADLIAYYDRKLAKGKEEIATKQKAAEDVIKAKQKKIAIAQAIINGALAVTNILAHANMLLWPILIPFSIATTALQVKAIQEQTYAQGGMVRGNPNIIDSVPAWLTDGEYVVNRQTVERVGGQRGVERRLNQDVSYYNNREANVVINVGTFVGNKTYMNTLIDEIRKELPRRI